MSHDMATDLRTVAGNGAKTLTTGDFALEPVKRRVRLPELAVGLVVVVGFALAAVLWQLNATQKEPVLAAARDLSRGDVLTARDLRVVYVSADDPIAHVGRDELARLVGRTVLSDVEAGALLTPAMTADGSALAPGEGVVGLSLEPGQVPTTRLRPGDLVNVVAAPSAGTEPAAQAQADEVLVERAEVFAVEELTASGRFFVSLKAPERDANRVAAAAERGKVRLVMVGR